MTLAPGPAYPAVPDRTDPLVRRLFVGIALSALGSGLTLPFLYVYLAEVRGIPTATVGLLFAWMGLLGFAGSPLGGTLIDRFGPRPVMLWGLVAEALGVASVALVHTAWQALAVASFITHGRPAPWAGRSARTPWRSCSGSCWRCD